MHVPSRGNTSLFQVSFALPIEYARGNYTDQRRRGFIANFRAKAMIDWERLRNFDHGRVDNSRKVRNELAGSELCLTYLFRIDSIPNFILDMMLQTRE